MIRIHKIDETTFDVAISEPVPTRHRVTVSPDYYNQLTGGRVPVEQLLRLSFEFLLQREPNTAILDEFELPQIGRYFPDYEQTIRRQLQTA